jgi:hypothetical protein
MLDQGAVPEIWDQLNAASIHLEDIVTRDVQPQLVNYLKSYSGLKRFELRSRYVRRARTGLAESCADLYRVVFPMHKDSLNSLWLMDRRNIHLCITVEHIASISLCKKLSVLSVTMNSDDIDDINSTKQILINAAGLPSLLNLEIDFSLTGPKFGGCCIRRHVQALKLKVEGVITTIDMQNDFPAGLSFREIKFAGDRYLPGIDVDSRRKFMKVEALTGFSFS